MSKLMILGGSNCQKNALLAAKRLGHQTILVDYYETPPGAALADIHVRESTFDIPACIGAVKKYGVDGIFTIGTDQPVLTAARVAEACGLPSLISTKTALGVTNKRVMKQTLTRLGIPTAYWRLIDRAAQPNSLAGLHPPYVLKPLDSQGQRGIFKLETEKEVLEHLSQTLSFSRKSQALVETFYPSEEITVSAWVDRGQVTLLSISDRLLFDHPTHIGVCVGHRIPSVHRSLFPQIEALAKTVASGFSVFQGPLYIQLLTGEDGLVVNELACRIGGAFEDVFIPWLTGFDILEAVLYGALGQRVKCSVPPLLTPSANKKQASVQLLFCKPGQACRITPIEVLRQLPGVLDVGYNFKEGESIPPLENATARFGHCVITTENDDLEARLAHLYKVFHVLDNQGQNLVIPRNLSGEPYTQGHV